MINQRSIFKSLILIGAVVSAALFPVVSFGAAGINKQLPYQGVLKTSGGVKVSDGNYDMIFKIYDAPSGGNILWTGTHTAANGNAVTVTDGVFSALLGSGSGNTMIIDFSDDTLYLGIKVGADSEMTPRKRIGAAGYAFNTDKLDGIDSSFFARLDQANTMQSPLVVNGQVKSTAASGGGTVSSLYVESIFPALAFYETGVTADNKLWDFFADGEALSLRAVNDANTAASNILVVNRTGTTIDSINFDSNTLFIDAANNRVGVGANVPGAQLDVATPDNDQVVKLQRTGTNAGAGYIYANGNEMFGVNDGTNYPFMIRQTAPGWALYVHTDGRIGLNTGSPNQGKMEVKGGSVCVDTNSDNNAASCIANESDARLKENVMTIDGALDKILQLRGVSFDWKVNDPEVLKHYPLIARFASSTHSLGLIAQEAQGIVPEAIMQETVGDDEAQYLQLDYDKIVPLLVEGVKDIASLADGFKRQFIIWFADAANGIGDFFAKRIHTETICLKKFDGKEYCVNGDDLEAIMSGREENVTAFDVVNMQTTTTTTEIIDVATEQNTANNDSDIVQNETEESYQTQIDINVADAENIVATSTTSATEIILAPIEPKPEP